MSLSKSRAVLFAVACGLVLCCFLTILLTTSGSSPTVRVLFPKELGLLIKDIGRAVGFLCLVPCAACLSYALSQLRTAPKNAIMPALKALAIYLCARALPFLAYAVSQAMLCSS